MGSSPSTRKTASSTCTEPRIRRSAKAAVRELIVALLQLVPDIAFEPKRLYSGDDHIVFEYDMSGTFDGSPFVCDGVDVIAVADGLVTRKETYVDAVTLVEQVGALPQIGALTSAQTRSTNQDLPSGGEFQAAPRAGAIWATRHASPHASL